MQDAFFANVARQRCRLPQEDLDLLAGGSENTVTVSAHKDVFRPGRTPYLHVLQDGWVSNGVET